MDIISLPVIISKEGKWFVACCPVLDIATQGRNEKDVKENSRYTKTRIEYHYVNFYNHDLHSR